MSRFLPNYIAITLLTVLPTSALIAADTSAADAKLRENLKNTMLQLRTAETERAALQAKQTESEQKIKAMAEQVAAQAKQLVADKDDADKSIAELRTKVDERDREIAELRVSLDKWKVDHKKVADVAASKEGQRAKLASDVIVLNRKVADQQTKNAVMFKLGNEILTRYEKFGLGDALTAREPFVGITRVKFENLMQDYQDKLAEQKIKP
jgi:chromosome segregation ATPase